MLGADPWEMPMSSEPVGLLLRFPDHAATALSAAGHNLGIGGTAFELEPLFAVSVPALQNELGVGAAGGMHQWYVARPKTGTSGINPWDLAHQTLTRFSTGTGLAASPPPDIVEPDFLQDWTHASKARSNEPLAAANDVCKFGDQNPDLPTRPKEFAWHLNDAFSQLRKARTQASVSAAVVRILHLDTGYDPLHKTFPASQAELALQRNFIDSNAPNDARDPGVTGTLKNPGHGTGTLSILAGAHFQYSQNGYQFDDDLGAVQKAKIVPVRVGNSVVQLTTSSVAKGINYAVELCQNPQTRIDVISMSMGGVASAAWADAVNKAYDAGIIYVAAAGNNISAGFFGFPTHQIVYPARFRRVIAACGVMADRRPYYGLSAGTMQGNWGPEGSMATALSAYTPNVPWARWGCPNIVGMDGAGTSAATPQIAAAAALYLQRHAAALFDPAKYPEPWMRVEAVRRALFASADKTADGGSSEKLGNGILRAAAALELAPSAVQFLQKRPPDSAGFPFLNVLSSTGLTASPADQMLQLEATQLVDRWRQTDIPNPLETAVSDPDRRASDVTPNQVRDYLDIVSRHPAASQHLQKRAQEVLDGMVGRSSPKKPSPRAPQAAASPVSTPAAGPSKKTAFVPPTPPHRKLRGYAVDPSLTTKLDTVGISEMMLKVPWDDTLQPGPVGEYLEVMDIDPASGAFYTPVNLNDPLILAQDGLAPSEGVPQFHQQMVYAISSLTIKNFEHALGRKTLWRPGPGKFGKDDSNFVQRLRVYPHALREANAYYSPQKIALLFGYFNALPGNSQEQLPGGRVFTCLSHDIVAHETTHALLDGMHRRFLVPSNRDVHAFHEGFADCVAMLQHFTFPELVAHQIAATRGSIDSQENLLVQLASQFGSAMGQRTALRDAIGDFDKQDNRWKVREPDTREYETVVESHDRGRILVSAVFDAFLSIYKRRTADLMRLATGGTGILRPGAVHPDLITRLSNEAAKSAQHVLLMCIRALDYCPPTDITFGEYLRAIITADFDLVPDDDLNYRVSFLEAFRRRGIYPPGIRTMSIGSLVWRSPDEDDPPPSKNLMQGLERTRGWTTDHLYTDSRAEIFRRQREMRIDLHNWLAWHIKTDRDGKQDATFLGLDPTLPFEVHSARIAFRTSPDGGTSPQLLLSLLQSTKKPVDSGDPRGPQMSFEGGSTIVADLRTLKVCYCIRKPLRPGSRLLRQQEFALREFDSLQATYLGLRALDSDSAHVSKEPFAFIHRHS